MINYGLPYMGSKSKIVNDIIPYILNRHPGRDLVIDLFGGGVSVTDYILKNTEYIEVIYNDFDGYITALVDALSKGRRTLKGLLTYIDRTRFQLVLDSPEQFSPDHVAFVRLVYSFGNRGDAYLYGKDIEDIKRAIHFAIVDNHYGTMFEMLGIDDYEPLLHQLQAVERPLDNVAALTMRRVQFLKILYNYLKTQDRFQDEFINRITASEHISRIERLLSLFDGVQDLSRLTIFNYDYRELLKEMDTNEWRDTLDSVVVYCDPPYADTAEYMVGSFDSDAFWDWVRSTKYKYPVYVSSYTAPPDIECVWEQGKRGLFAMNSENNNKIIEKVFYNGYKQYTEQLFDLLGG